MNRKSSNLKNLIMSDIKCFQHCKDSEKYLCFDLPEKCPACFSSLMDSKIKFKVPPFVVPKPLNITNTQFKLLPPNSLLLQPTDCDYEKLISEPDLGDLHIGITNSDSDVFDFNSNGLNKNSHNWIETPSIVIDIYNCAARKLNQEEIFSYSNDELSIDSKWNDLLDRNWKRRKEIWNRAFYDENNFNCLDFIINFLLEYGFFEHDDFFIDTDNNFMNSHKKNPFILNCSLKNKLSKEYIEPEFVKFIKYLKLLVSLDNKKCLMENIL